MRRVLILCIILNCILTAPLLRTADALASTEISTPAVPDHTARPTETSAASVPELDAAALWNYARANQINTIEDLVTALPASFKEKPILIYDSRSVQEASPDFPRTVLSTDDARFVLTFNGNASQVRYKNLEIMQFRQHQFEFYEISFPPSATPPQKNPANCLSCHRADPRPNWDTPLLLPGVVGSEPTLPKIESTYINSFVEHQPDRPRYHGLGLVNPQVAGQFSARLSALNEEKIFGDLKAAATWSKIQPFQKALLAALACVEPFGKHLADILPGSQWNTLRAETRSFEAQSLRERIERQTSLNQGPYDQTIHQWSACGDSCAAGEHADAVAALRDVMRAAGVPMDEWSLEFGSHYYSFSAPGAPLLPTLTRLLWQDALTGPGAIAGLAAQVPDPGTISGAACDSLFKPSQ